jgi:glycosyltransferase involved in cell wall biosynthesis
MKLSVIIPVYNEFESIEEILKHMEAAKMSGEIIIVDDDSKDGTRNILHKKKQGNGAASTLHPFRPMYTARPSAAKKTAV